MGTGDENRWWADEAERVRVFDVDPETGHYRRFFDIDDLAGVRVEDPEVFALTHAQGAPSSCATGSSTGCASTTPTGSPTRRATCERLRDAGAQRVWVEKILHPGEPLRDWPVEGTVGYEFLNEVQGLFVDPAGEEPLTALYVPSSTGDAAARSPSSRWKRSSSRRAARSHARCSGCGAIHDPGELEQALAALPVYRTYVRDGVLHRRRPRGAGRGRAARSSSTARPEEFVSRFQQTSPPVTRQGRRGHRLLPLPAAARAQRGRRRPGPLRAVGRRVPRGQRRARAALPARRC